MLEQGQPQSMTPECSPNPERLHLTRIAVHLAEGDARDDAAGLGDKPEARVHPARLPDVGPLLQVTVALPPVVPESFAHGS